MELGNPTDEESISGCGLMCWECPAHVATRTCDRDMLERTANMWSEAKENLEELRNS